MIKELFKKNNIKLTHQRELVFNIVKESDEEATIKIIHDKSEGKIDTSTIYRIIDLFLDKNIFIKNLAFDGTIYYTFNDCKHIHYIECIKCHKHNQIDYCPIKDIEEHLCKKDGYTLLQHTVRFDAICDDCKKLISK